MADASGNAAAVNTRLQGHRYANGVTDVLVKLALHVHIYIDTRREERI